MVALLGTAAFAALGFALGGFFALFLFVFVFGVITGMRGKWDTTLLAIELERTLKDLQRVIDTAAIPLGAVGFWWELRRAQNLKPATYTCPLCGRRLASMSDHILLFQEGDHSARRHAHTCAARDGCAESRI